MTMLTTAIRHSNGIMQKLCLKWYLKVCAVALDFAIFDELYGANLLLKVLPCPYTARIAGLY